MNESQGVIFDMDGVLVDSYGAHLESWREAARRQGASMSEEDFARTFGRTSREIIAQLWPGRFDPAATAAFDDDKEEAYREVLRRRFPEMPGAGALIAALHAAGFRLGIGSSGPPRNVAIVKERLSRGDLLDATVSSVDVKRGKPEPDVFLIAAAKLSVEPRHCAAIEDAPAGVEAARRAGMAAIALTGTAPRAALAPRAHLVVDSLSELNPDVIAGLIRKNAGA